MEQSRAEQSRVLWSGGQLYASFYRLSEVSVGAAVLRVSLKILSIDKRLDALLNDLQQK